METHEKFQLSVVKGTVCFEIRKCSGVHVSFNFILQLKCRTVYPKTFWKKLPAPKIGPKHFHFASQNEFGMLIARVFYQNLNRWYSIVYIYLSLWNRTLRSYNAVRTISPSSPRTAHYTTNASARHKTPQSCKITNTINNNHFTCISS